MTIACSSDEACSSYLGFVGVCVAKYCQCPYGYNYLSDTNVCKITTINAVAPFLVIATSAFALVMTVYCLNKLSKVKVTVVQVGAGYVQSPSHKSSRQQSQPGSPEAARNYAVRVSALAWRALVTFGSNTGAKGKAICKYMKYMLMFHTVALLTGILVAARVITTIHESNILLCVMGVAGAKSFILVEVWIKFLPDSLLLQWQQKQRSLQAEQLESGTRCSITNSKFTFANSKVTSEKPSGNATKPSGSATKWEPVSMFFGVRDFVNRFGPMIQRVPILLFAVTIPLLICGKYYTAQGFANAAKAIIGISISGCLFVAASVTHRVFSAMREENEQSTHSQGAVSGPPPAEMCNIMVRKARRAMIVCGFMVCWVIQILADEILTKRTEDNLKMIRYSWPKLLVPMACVHLMVAAFTYVFRKESKT